MICGIGSWQSLERSLTPRSVKYDSSENLLTNLISLRMLLSSLPYTVLGLIVAVNHPVVAIRARSESASPGPSQVNYYSDPECYNYQGSLPEPSVVVSANSGYVLSLDNQFIGSVLLVYLTGNGQNTLKFNAISASGPDVAMITGGQPDRQESQGKSYSNCYTINNTVTAITYYNINLNWLWCPECNLQ